MQEPSVGDPLSQYIYYNPSQSSDKVLFRPSESHLCSQHTTLPLAAFMLVDASTRHCNSVLLVRIKKEAGLISVCRYSGEAKHMNENKGKTAGHPVGTQPAKTPGGQIRGLATQVNPDRQSPVKLIQGSTSDKHGK